MTVNEKATEKAVKALVAAIGIPEHELSRIEINCGGSVKVFTRSRAYFTIAHVPAFRTEGAK